MKVNIGTANEESIISVVFDETLSKEPGSDRSSPLNHEKSINGSIEIALERSNQRRKAHQTAPPPQRPFPDETTEANLTETSHPLSSVTDRPTRHVQKLSDPYQVTKWMVQNTVQLGTRHIPSK